MTIVLKILFATFLLVFTSFADDRVAKAVFIDPPNDAPRRVFLVAPEKDAIEVELPRRNLSEDIIIPAGDLVYAILPEKLEEGETVPAGMPVLKISSEWSRTYLIFEFDKKAKKFPIKVKAIDGSAGKFPAGHTRLINLTEARIHGKFGSKEVSLLPDQVKNLGPVVQGRGDFPVLIRCLEKGAEKPKTLKDTRWQHDPRSRQLVFISEPAGARIPTIRCLSDIEKITQ